MADAIANRLDGLAGPERWLPVRAQALLDLRTETCKRFGTDPDVVRFEDRLAEAIPIRRRPANSYWWRGKPLRHLIVCETAWFLASWSIPAEEQAAKF